jgi:hypothetical protein
MEKPLDRGLPSFRVFGMRDSSLHGAGARIGYRDLCMTRGNPKWRFASAIRIATFGENQNIESKHW